MTAPDTQTDAAGQTQMVDLFAGPGGLDVAARWLGVIAEGLEWDDDAVATRRAAGLRTRHVDVRSLGPRDFPEASILTGGPPCQTYTVAGSGSGRRALEQVLGFVKSMAAGNDVSKSLEELEDERTGLVLEPLRYALQAHERGRPYEAILLEQVPAVWPVWDAVGEALEGIGYKVTCGLLRTEEFGVPQTRRRAVLLARLDSKPELPTPTHRVFRKGLAREEGDQSRLPWETMARALSRSDAFTVVSNYGTGGDPKARGRRGSWEPSATVTGKVSRNRLVDHDGNDLGRFTPAEAGRLQTFPVDYPWSGNAVAQQIGNAIPPLLAAHALAAVLKLPVDRAKLEACVDMPWGQSDGCAQNSAE